MKTVQDPEKINKVKEFYENVTKSHYDFLDFWLKNTLFHWDFWLSLFLTIIPWIIWIKYRKKESTGRLITCILFVIFLSSWLDFIGTTYGLWFYTGKVIPTIPSYIPWDFSILPIVISFFLQIKPEYSYIKKAFLFAGISAFIGEPIFIWLGFYVNLRWNVFYSFPIYLLIYIAAHKFSKIRGFDPI
ncbi:CBO0543 family protein [Brevibacillus sp. SYSU BS000544]|uniref:CBO0543 family protein n=1 Tax=Brevibacillus sp. SYSU BS000544 TaxID=3416443 RepID=UPI003CE4C116